MCSADQANPAEPSWLRQNLLPHLELPVDLPAHFIGEKTVTPTDLDVRQSQFYLPARGVLRNLRPILTSKQLQAANLHATAATEPRKHGGGRSSGLPVLVADVQAGIIELEMWNGYGTRLKGDGYMDFIAGCSFTAGDVVQIWAFNPCFSPLYLVLAKIS
jgi:hypothetical protein